MTWDVWSQPNCMSLHGVGGCKAERLRLLRERAVHDRPGPTALRDNAKRTKSKTPKTTKALRAAGSILFCFISTSFLREIGMLEGGLHRNHARCGIGLSSRPVDERKAAPAALAT
jgi:hypothetical protein